MVHLKPSQFRVIGIAVLFVTVVLAGCVSEDEPEPGQGDETQEVDPTDVEVQADKGVLIGTVVSDVFKPIAGAEVVIREIANTTTDAKGRFIFEDLEPAKYDMFAQAPGHDVTEETVDVVAGQKTQHTFILAQLPSAEPRVFTDEWSGFLECQLGLQVLLANCIPIQNIIAEYNLPNPTSTRQIHTWLVDDEGLEAIVVELVWQPPEETFAKELELIVEEKDAGISGIQFGRATGSSPVRLELTGEPLANLTDNASKAEPEPVFQTRVFPPNDLGNVVFQQKFTIYVSYFYYQQPKPGFTGIPDG